MYAMKWYTDFAEMQYGRLAPFFFGGGGRGFPVFIQ